MINVVKKLWSGFHKSKLKKDMRYEIEYLEYVLQYKNEWSTNLNTVIRILETIDDRVLEESNNETLNKYTCYTGFQNSKHLIDWIANVRSNIHNGILLGDETRDIVYHRKYKTLKDFVISEGKINTTMIGFKKQLLYGLKELEIEIDTIADSRTKSRELSIINSAVRDIFAVVETIIAWGVADE